MKKIIQVVLVLLVLITILGINSVSGNQDDSRVETCPILVSLQEKLGFSLCGLFSGTPDQEVTNLPLNKEDVLKIAQEKIDFRVGENNVYLADTWWVIYYSDEVGSQMIRINSLTGEIVEEHNSRYSDNFSSKSNDVHYDGCWC
ncbi:hypothetical protein [Methanosalsum natronophilum]|uniref:PepSY domain-containing protein n=1 Tax=Methanosalsum natronophilum TaxID=768733 RepID=A0A424Z3Y5_9EURY|nr:hypothetical protein [Methanosalsum natronophilum]MCS3924141.1 hypothetical protein [Methanosalsum natronophilum]RQD90724.1 MAG: hypothetical protein D5R95_01615 [Methanosalsum natronophilum]